MRAALFRALSNTAAGPGPQLMGANTLRGKDVYNKDDEDLGERHPQVLRHAVQRRL